MQLTNIQGRAVYIVVRPWDYTCADVLGVFDSEAKANVCIESLNGTQDDSGNIISNLCLEISYIE